jgi:hypothetical protein
VSSLSAAAFVTGNAFAKKSSKSDGGGGGGSSDNGDGGGGGNSDKGGSSSDTGGGGGSSDTGGGGGGGSDTGSTSTPPPATGETTAPPAAEENTAAPPPPAAENQQQSPCPDGSPPDENGKCPPTSSEQNTAPPAAAGEQATTCPSPDPTTGACPTTTTTEQNTAPPAPTDQTCPGGSTPDPMTGDCPSTTTTLAPNQKQCSEGQHFDTVILGCVPDNPPTSSMTTGGATTTGNTGTTTTPASTQGALDLQVPDKDGKCPQGYRLINTNVCAKDAGTPSSGGGATTSTPPATQTGTTTGAAVHINSDGTLGTDANTDGSCPQGSDHTSDPKQCKVISMQANQDGTCPVHTSHFQGADDKQCFVDTALQTGNTGVTTPAPVDCKVNPDDPSCTTASLASPTAATQGGCPPGTEQYKDNACTKQYLPYVLPGVADSVTCPSGSHKLAPIAGIPGGSPTAKCVIDGYKCPDGTFQNVEVCVSQRSPPTTEPAFTAIDVDFPRRSPLSGEMGCKTGTLIGDRCVVGAMDIGGVQPSGTCSAGNKIGNRCMIIPTQEIPMPKVLGKCPADYHVLEPGVSCAFNIKIQASTPPPTTQTGGTGTGTGTTTQTGNTGTGAGGGGGTGTPTPTNTGKPTTPTTPMTTTTPTTPPTSTTTNTNVINRGGSSGGGGGSGGTTTASSPPAAQGSNAFLTYVNSINKITMKYPSTWTKTDLVGNPSIPVMFSAPTTVATGTTPNTAAKTSFVISITPSAASLDSFAQQQLNTLTQSKAIKYTITSTDAKVLTPPTGITAFREVSYDAVKTNVPLKGAAIFFVNGGTGYSLLYLAKQTEYTQNIPMVQQMVNSFQVAGSGAASGGGAPVQNVAAATSR